MSILEVFTEDTRRNDVDWREIVGHKHCSYIGKTCIKTRKSDPSIAIGTCTVQHGVRNSQDIIICPQRFLERGQIFIDCLHLLTNHEPGNELHKVAEVSIPGGNVDYFLVSVRSGKVMDFVGIELQAVDTTGTVWPPRQRFLRSVGLSDNETPGAEIKEGFGINWKMTAKTTLVQLHHKIQTFEHINKKFVLVLQDTLMAYMVRAFNFNAVHNVRLGDSMHFHPYSLIDNGDHYRLNLAARASTDANGIAECLGQQVDPRVELDVIVAALEAKISPATLLTL